MGKRSKEKEGHRKEKKRRRQDSSPPSPHQLVLDAAVGDRKACKSLLKAGVDVHYADADLNTALHEVRGCTAAAHSLHPLATAGHKAPLPALARHPAAPAFHSLFLPRPAATATWTW